MTKLEALHVAVLPGLLSATVLDGNGWLAMTEYGWEMLELYEEMMDE